MGLGFFLYIFFVNSWIGKNLFNLKMDNGLKGIRVGFIRIYYKGKKRKSF